MNRLRIAKWSSCTLAIAAVMIMSCWAFAEKAPMTKEQLQSTATHVVVGKVQAIYSRKELKRSYQYTHYVAEVKVDKLEKGEGISGLVYVRYLDIEWIGKGEIPPGPSGHYPSPTVGETYRIYLAQNAYDGMNDENKDGGYNVIYGNGFQPVKQP